MRRDAIHRAEAVLTDIDRRVRSGESGDLWAAYDRELRLLHSPFPAILRRGL